MKEQVPLDDLFDLARRQTSDVSDQFMARVLADAEAVQSELVSPRTKRTERKAGLLSRLIAALGGAISVAGIGTAAMAGLVVGYVQPDAVATIADSYGVSVSGGDLDIIPAYDTLFGEEDAQ